MTGLAPAWVHLRSLADNTNIVQPSITEIGNGQYKFSYDPEASGEAAGQVDAGATLANPADRYIDILLTRDSSRILSGIDAAGRVNLSASGLDAVPVEAGINARQALSPILAACAGVVSGAGTGTVTIKGGNVATTRVTATTDGLGNRTQVILTLPT